MLGLEPGAGNPRKNNTTGKVSIPQSQGHCPKLGSHPIFPSTNYLMSLSLISFMEIGPFGVRVIAISIKYICKKYLLLYDVFIRTFFFSCT